MKKLIGLTEGKKPVRVMIAVSAVAILIIGAFFVIGPGSVSASTQNEAPQLLTMEKTDLVKTLSASGVVKSANTQNIYSTQTSPVQEIYVSVGDRVYLGDVLARLDMSRVENDIKQAELNLTSAQNSNAEERRANGNSVANAQNSLASAQLSLERQIQSTTNAEKDLEDAAVDADKSFDSYAYDRAVEDARIALERRTAEYEDAQAESFDTYTSRNSINDAERNYERKQNDAYTASQNYYDALSRYHDAPPETKDAAWSAALSAESAMEAAGRAAEDAGIALDRAKKDLTRSTDDYAKQENDKVTKALQNMTDAQRAYDKALSDRERAEKDYADANETKLKNAQRALSDSQKQLASAETSLQAAQNTYDQARNKPSTSGVNIDLQSLTLEKLQDQLAEGLIIATADGVVTEINAKVGAAPSGIMFVIEDVDDLYVSAKVKEYSLNDLRLGQSAYTTTDATIGEVYPSSVIYISPKAVSPAGSTSVEFEIHAQITGHDTAVKIGMNAFLEVVTHEKTGVYAIPLSAMVTDSRGSFIYAYEDGGIREIPVLSGMKTSTHVEITGEDLYDGLQILARPADRG